MAGDRQRLITASNSDSDYGESQHFHRCRMLRLSYSWFTDTNPILYHSLYVCWNNKNCTRYALHMKTDAKQNITESDVNAVGVVKEGEDDYTTYFTNERVLIPDVLNEVICRSIFFVR